MIVEDDLTSIKLLRILLEEVHGFEVSVARRGADVMALSEKDNPDIFLVDYHLIDMDGVELIHSLRASTSFAKTPIVMASGMDVEHEALQAGANTFLTKPYEPDDLSNMFRTLLAATAVPPAEPSNVQPQASPSPASTNSAVPAAEPSPTETTASATTEKSDPA
jgi:DNA-binding response OmpR family regulator